MPWCPKCKNEYREGIRVCADCGTELVDTLNPVIDPNNENTNLISILYGPSQNIEWIVENVKKAGIVSVTTKECEKEGNLELLVDESERDATIEAVQMLMRARQEAEQKIEEAERRKNTDQPIPERYEEYVSSKDKAKEMKSSAIMLIVMAIIGFIFMTLMILHVLPFGFGTGVRAILCYGVLGGFFAVLLGSGIASFMSGKKMAKKSMEEDELTKEAREWANEFFTVENLDNVIKQNGDSNQMYFIRIAFMKQTMMRKFPDLKENFVDGFVEEKYGELYD